MHSRLAAAPAPHRFSRADVQRMEQAGMFGAQRVELLEGAVVNMSPQGSRHSAAVHRLWSILAQTFASDSYFRLQSPIILDDWSEPEPDLVVCDRDAHDYAHEHPRPNRIRAVIEVADASLDYDRGDKAAAYAASGIAAYLIVDLQHDRVEVLGQPNQQTRRYEQVQVFLAGESFALLGRPIAVSAVLPSR